MAGPWEQYQQAQAPAPQAGPWMQYQQPPQAQEPAQAAPEQPGMLDQIGRQLGLTARYGMEGAGNLANLVTEPIRQNVTDPLARMMSGGPNLSDLITGNQAPQGESTGDAMSRLADSLGLPKPEGSLEQGVGNASRALVGTGLSAGAGLAARAPQLAAQPLMQAISTLTGSGAQTTAQEAGAGPGGQLIASLAGGLTPGALSAGTPAAVRTAIRGTDPSKLNQNIAAFESAGTTGTVGQMSENRVMRALESLIARVPGGAGVMQKKAATQADETGAGLQALADKLAQKTSPTTAGRTIEQGITGDGGFVSRFKEQASKLYDQVDQHMPAQTPVAVPATKNFLAQASTPTKGAEATSALLSNPKLAGIGQALNEDLSKAANGTLPYEAVKALRTRVGTMIADAGITSDVPRGELKRLYGALSEDIRNTAAQNPKALAATNRAENYYRAGMDRIERVESVVNKAGGPEKIFAAATSGTREGATTLRSVMQSLKPEEAKILTSTVVRRLGRANPGAQNDTGDAFSTETFLTNWNGLSKEAKSTLFDRMGPDYRASMDNVARMASNLRSGSKVFRNPSGTSDATIQAATVGSAVTSLLMGSPAGAAGVAAAVGGANIGAKLLTNPTFVRWLGRNTNRPIGSLNAQIGVLANMGKDDPDITEFVEQLR